MKFKEKLIEYIKGYGFSEACSLLNITEDEAITELDKPTEFKTFYHRKPSKKRNSLNAAISEVIANNYRLLYKEFVKNKQESMIGQSTEDIFQDVLVALLEHPESTEENILDYIRKQLRAAITRNKQDYKQFKRDISNANIEATEKELSVEE